LKVFLTKNKKAPQKQTSNKKNKTNSRTTMIISSPSQVLAMMMTAALTCAMTIPQVQACNLSLLRRRHTTVTIMNIEQQQLSLPQQQNLRTLLFVEEDARLLMDTLLQKEYDTRRLEQSTSFSMMMSLSMSMPVFTTTSPVGKTDVPKTIIPSPVTTTSVPVPAPSTISKIDETRNTTNAPVEINNTSTVTTPITTGNNNSSNNDNNNNNTSVITKNSKSKKRISTPLVVGIILGSIAIALMLGMGIARKMSVSAV
jgi:adenine-specific DNA glycosylase